MTNALTMHEKYLKVIFELKLEKWKVYDKSLKQTYGQLSSLIG